MGWKNDSRTVNIALVATTFASLLTSGPFEKIVYASFIIVTVIWSARKIMEIIWLAENIKWVKSWNAEDKLRQTKPLHLPHSFDSPSTERLTMSSNPQASAISGAHDALNRTSFPTIAAAQEAAHKSILGKMSASFDDARIHIEGDEQGISATMKIRVDPTDGEDDAFEIVFIGTLGPNDWTFNYQSSDYIKDKR